MKKILLLITFFFCFSAVKAEIKLPNIIGSNMVIQQNADVRFWGKAAKNAKVEVSVSWNSQKFSTQADKDGNFSVTVTTKNFTFEPQTVKFTDLSDKKSVELSNILIGEVWLASGQSNMQMPLKGFPGCNVEDGFEEIMFSTDQADRVRFFSVPLKHSYNLEEDVEAVWTVPNVKNSTEYSAVAWYYAKALSHSLGCPVGIVSAAYGGTVVESWMSKQLLEQHGVSTKKEDIEAVKEEYLKILLPYNAMFWPIHKFTYKGVIWYQGCSNVGQHKTYYQRLKSMISLWRSDIGLGDIPFYMVEIAPYDYGSGDAPFLREAQFKVAKEVKNCGLVTTSDLALPQERYNIHPRQKKAVGQRLAALSLNKTYGYETFITSGPVFKELIVEKNEAFVGFDNLQMGICSNYMIDGFEIAGADKKFYPADSVWLRWQTNHVVVSSKKVEKPVAVRYCFKDFYTGNLLYGGGMIPAYPFRTDDWDDVK